MQRVSLLRFTVFDDPRLACGYLDNETSGTGRLFRGCWNNLRFPAARDPARPKAFGAAAALGLVYSVGGYERLTAG
jgi:hypothetical protein